MKILRPVEQYIPSLREAIVARPDCGFSSCDFKAGELFTHSQSCIWILGYSDLGQALLANKDPHSAGAANAFGIAYDEFIKRKKEPALKNLRQSFKPFSFGKPTGMSDWKIVFSQRIQGPDTPSETGPSWIDDGNGGKIRGWKGLRFCVLMRGAKVCGAKKTYFLNRRGYKQPIKPVCSECLECAVELGAAWKAQWQENEPYFNWVSDVQKRGMLIKGTALERWPWLKDFFEPNTRLAPGTVMQHFSGRIRAGLDYSAIANTMFQAMLADIAKRALVRAQQECFDRTVRIAELAYENSRKSRYAGGPSPLLGSRIIGFFHDELYGEHPKSVTPEAAERVSEIMTEEIMYVCPDVAETAEAEPAISEVWNKNAECVRDANGRLQFWEPKRAAA